MRSSLHRFFALFAVVLVALVSARAAHAAHGPSDGLGPDVALDRGSPRRSFEGFLRAGGGGDFLRAAHYLDLRSITPARQASEGPELAQQLWYVTTHIGRFDVFKVPDDAEATVPKGDAALVVGSLDDRDGPVPIAMERVKFPDGVERWIFARSTVAIAPSLYATLARPQWSSRLPAWMNDPFLGNAAWQWLALIALIPLSYFGARLLAAALFASAGTIARRVRGREPPRAPRLRRPVRLTIGAVLFWVASERLFMTELVRDLVGHVVFTMLVVSIAWAMLRAIEALARWFEDRAESGDGIDAEALQRAARTRAALFERLAAVTITVLALAVALLQFAVVRSVGVSLLASAGVAGVVLGFAAQRSLGAIIGGIQLALTQPIRIGDAVCIEHEHGTVDRIYLTHVVVRRWDDRRVVFPVSRFLEQPFQNLSKFGSQQTGVVRLTCDATASVDELRDELRRICEASPLWDRRLCALEVVEVSPATMSLRALVSASDPIACGKLECHVRERIAPALVRPAKNEGEGRPSDATKARLGTMRPLAGRS